MEDENEAINTTIIKLDEEYSIKWDAHNFILQKIIITEPKDSDSKPVKSIKILGYYSRPEHALSQLIHQKGKDKLNKKRSVTFEQFYKVMVESKEEVQKMLEPLKAQMKIK